MERIDVAVVGGGWAGLAAAVELGLAGRRPTIFEAAPVPGGRARGVRVALAGRNVDLDNGQHLLIGAYREWLRIAGVVGVTRDRDLVRERMRLVGTDGLRLRAWPLPAPLHLLGALLGANGLPWPERLAALRLMTRLRRDRWRVREGETVQGLLERMGQPESITARLWAPLAFAALNTPPEQACARAFAAVLRDSLGADAGASDFVLPRRTLSQLLPEPAARWLQNRGARLLLRTGVRGLAAENGGWRIESTRGEYFAERVVLAVPPYAAARLLAGAATNPQHRALLRELARFEYDSIATVYLGWSAASRIELPRWTMLDERAGPQAWGQWLFDRGTQDGARIAAVVVSARGRLSDVAAETLAAGIATQVAHQLRVPAPADARTIVERRATIRCTPTRPSLHPDAFSAASARGDSFCRLALAGDYACPDYPATLESAVRSGVQAARLLLR